ncbi:hypothetical protein D9615_007793 [Tricholomella constricta]|uniref:Uncharacterized protein n=1 Tax=Tricholomella constricta TaxID=117010 RepID=A0A8H5H4N6_9AGAR|nr:hypothetical protein D9615_007793 [Tricholomella constricta]
MKEDPGPRHSPPLRSPKLLRTRAPLPGLFLVFAPVLLLHSQLREHHILLESRLALRSFRAPLLLPSTKPRPTSHDVPLTLPLPPSPDPQPLKDQDPGDAVRFAVLSKLVVAMLGSERRRQVAKKSRRRKSRGRRKRRVVTPARTQENKDLNVRPYPPNPPEPDEPMHLDAKFSLPNILLSSASGRGLGYMLTGDAAALLAKD